MIQNKYLKIFMTVYVILFTLLSALLPYITDYREYIIIKYISLIPFVFIPLLIISTVSLYFLKNKNLYILSIILLFFTIPLSLDSSIIFLLMAISYLIVYIAAKRIKSIVITIVIILIAIFFSYDLDGSDSNYFKTRTVDIPFSPNQIYYGYCRTNEVTLSDGTKKIEYTVAFRKKRKLISILDRITDSFPKMITVNNCNIEEVKWIDDNKVEINGEEYILDEID